jgi:nucleotide-binding universal stress UspA family protein
MAGNPVIACYRGPDSAGALQLGAALATALRRPLLLAVAYEYEPVALSAVPVPPADAERRAEAAHDTARRARRLVGDGVVVREAVVAAQDIAVGLADLARNADACALVMGRDEGGHVVADLLPRARCPVLVSPFDVVVPGLQPLRAVAVADDGSQAAALARRAAERIAAAATGGEPELATLSVAGGADPAEELVAASGTYDLVACGSRGRGRLASAVLGSVSSRLVRGAHCPVLVVGPHVAADDDGPLGLTTAGRAG